MDARFDANAYPLVGGLRLLEASAGTGKTFALAHLCLRLVTEADHQLDAVLVVTYTEAAAAELRSRIGARLQQALVGLEALERQEPLPDADPVLEQWWSNASQAEIRQRWIRALLIALEQLDRADITTIHGFCRRSLRRLALSRAAAMEPQLEVDSNPLVLEVVQYIWQQDLMTLPVEQLRGLRQAGLSPERFRQALSRMDGDAHPQLCLDEEDFDPEQPLVDQLQAWVEKAWQQFQALWQRDSRALDDCFRRSAAQWKALGMKTTTPYSAKPRSDRCGVVDQWMATQLTCPDLAAIRDVEKPLREYFHPATWCRVARSCGERDPNLASQALQQAIARFWDGPVERVWRYVLQRGLQSLAERRRRRGVITFAGLLAAMDPGDADSSWLAPLRQRYRAVMVDEFQDTDPVQWRLLQGAFGLNQSHLLLLVGDPKQAIYRFRGGDLATYKLARSQVDRIDNLRDNYRTTAGLMEGLNGLMQPGLLRSALPVPSVKACSTLQAPALPEGQHPLQVMLVPGDAPQSKTALEQWLPAVMAGVVVRLFEEQPQLKPADLCILVGRHSQASELRTALARRGVPTRLVNQGDVLESEAALVLQRFIDALATPGDDRRLRLLATSPLLGWTTDELVASAQDGRLDQLAQRLQIWALRLPQLGLLGCLSELVDGRLMADLSERGRLLGDLQQAARLVQEAMHRQGLDVASAADWLRRERLHPSTPVPDARQPHSDLAESAVAVVTVHRSKGLEYPVVICPYLWQAPGEGTGPLWREGADGAWRIAVDRSWGGGWELSQQAQQEAVAEAERLAYVALTRAKSHLIVVWASAKGQEQSPLVAWLFGAEAVGQSIEDLSHERLQNSLTTRDLPISVAVLESVNSSQPSWQPSLPLDDLQLGPTPQRLDRSWGRSSYSAWISSPSADPWLEQGRDRDPEAEEASATSGDDWPEQGPLVDFPRGASAGDCLHRILEQIPFQASLLASGEQKGADEGADAVIELELRRAGLQPELSSTVRQGLDRVLSTPLGGSLGRLPLCRLSPDRRLHELSFDLPVQDLSTSDLVEVFRQDPKARFGGDYLERISRLSINSRGFLTGSIDLVFCDHANPEQGRWWVLDWKSNWIGERGFDGKGDLCGPRHYQVRAMHEQMLDHHYPLQAHLYLVALHRHLAWRLPGYAPERHLGGYVYVFLRGMPGEQGWRPGPAGPGRLVEDVPLQRVLTLDRLLQQGAA